MPPAIDVLLMTPRRLRVADSAGGSKKALIRLPWPTFRRFQIPMLRSLEQASQEKPAGLQNCLRNAGDLREKKTPRTRRGKGWRLVENAHALTAITAPSTAAATAVSLSGSEAVLAIDRAIASRLKRNRGLLPTAGTCNGCALRFVSVVSSPSASRLLVLLCLAARFAAFRSRIAALPKEGLIFA